MPLHVQRARPAGLIHNALAPIRAELVGVSLATCPTAGVYRTGPWQSWLLPEGRSIGRAHEPITNHARAAVRTAAAQRPLAAPLPPANRHTATRPPVQHPSHRSGKRGITEDLRAPTTAIGAAASRSESAGRR
jgi:hypothetical protein